MVRKKIVSIRILAIILGVSLLLTLFTGCEAERLKEPIVFADLGWESAQVHNRIAAFIIENGYGYPPSEFVPGETIPLFVGLGKGDVDVSMEVWVENQQEAYDEHIAAREFVDLGTNFDDNWQAWLVPTYMIEDGLLPEDISVSDMPDYWSLFQDDEDPSKGRFYSCIAGWECEKINEEKFSEYGLDENYNIFLPGSGAALLASMVAAYEKHEPWFGYYWAPTPAMGKYDMTIVEEPAYAEDVWETNHACAYPAVKVNIVVNAEWFDDDINAAAVEFLTKYNTTTDQNNAFLSYMLENNASYEEAAIYFLQNFEDVWSEWIPFPGVIEKVKAALP
jgi:glycine betaine/proline transport system substrate-binding protein